MGVKRFARILFLLCLLAGEVAAQSALPPQPLASDSLPVIWDSQDLSWISPSFLRNGNSIEPVRREDDTSDDVASSPGPIMLASFESPAQAEPGVTELPPSPQIEAVSPSPQGQVVPFSRPSPFQIAPETPPAGNNQNFYAGNPPVQDLSRLLPGKFSNTKYKWYGFVRVDAIFDYNPIATNNSFVTSAIPVPQGRGQNVAMSPRYTRIGFDTETPWDALSWTIKTRIEVDFFNGNTSGAFGSFPLRLRFAWADFGPFLIGQTASLFMDYDAFPNVLDYQGPPGMVLMRQPIVAVRIPAGQRLKFSAGVEQPYSDIQWNDGSGWTVNPGAGTITAPGVPRNVQDLPDFTGNVRYAGDYGHLQLAGIARKLTFQPAAGADSNVLGYGANLTGTFYPWACWEGCKVSDAKSPMEKSHFLVQYAAGKGISRYIQDLNGLGLDATFDTVNGLRALSSQGWFVAYEQWWAERWASNFTLGGSAKTDLTSTLPDPTFMQSTYYTGNIVWFPVERMGVGFEYMHGTREDKDGQIGRANRLQASFQYKF